MFKQISPIFRREFFAYFNTGLGSIMLAVYLLLSMFAAFYLGNFFEVGNFDLFSFFYFQPYIFLIVTPALTMRLWAEERKSGSIEFILTQPVSLTAVVFAKFLAAWSFAFVMLLSTVPFWIYMNAEFALDNMNILCAYAACILMAGMFCAAGCMISSFNSSPVTAYILTLFIIWGVIGVNFSPLIRLLPADGSVLSGIMQALNFDKHFQDMVSGQVSMDNLIYYFSAVFLSLWLNVVSIEYKKG